MAVNAFIGDTLHVKDTAGAVNIHCDTDDAIFLTPEAPTYTQNVSGGGVFGGIRVDSTDCNANGCKYWVNSMQIDTLINWLGLGYVCRFQGKPVAIFRDFKIDTWLVGYPNDTMRITCRDTITTPAGTTRHNMVWISGRGFTATTITDSSADPALSIIVSATAGSREVGTSLFNDYAIFTIVVASNASAGPHTFMFNVNIGGKYCGSIPCTINVVN